MKRTRFLGGEQESDVKYYSQTQTKTCKLKKRKETTISLVPTHASVGALNTFTAARSLTAGKNGHSGPYSYRTI